MKSIPVRVKATNTELQVIMNETQFTTMLSEGAVTVTFDKLNGDERVMLCTTSMSLIPEQNHPTKASTNTKSITVWDLNKQSWRSFKYDLVKKIEI